jgi:diguanylate cyclase (GGDEF)-like protein
VKIDIPDPLYEEYRNLVQQRFLSDDVSEYVQQLIQVELRKHCAPGYDLDDLTKCKSRYQLQVDINKATLGSSSQDHSIFRSDYLCIDIDNFKYFLDHYGLSTGDNILRDMAKQLLALYTNENVYRFGGDEFVVHLGGKQYLPLKVPSEIKLKYSIVKVTAQRNQRRNHFANRVILFHLDKGIITAKPEGNEIICDSNIN